MALLLASTPTPSFASPSSSSFPSTVNPVSRLHKVPNVVCPKLFNGLQMFAPFVVKERVAMIVKAASVDGMGSDGGEPPSEAKEESVPVESLPLESKLQLMQEQKLKMKLAKKVRLRRKRLVRKRHLRKKGRWPPSKMKKNKNV